MRVLLLYGKAFFITLNQSGIKSDSLNKIVSIFDLLLFAYDIWQYLSYTSLGNSSDLPNYLTKK